ncbi:hypothetical protein predicted by Glimmer/Critica [Bdellovibrio bacteriovorus HD100]|uniref:Uncharacterized protein n=1 Tax=Bdellovibrio bacteriovorus (strain ATCC 15356 / DSM 50701 / NCIMB 9529 / HD100) TaxID=264462 RepID=Q6MH59_BDEBA|nr:hypothetical protein predicted by Glimmer/Critica [Bdellovibrio bacteriovorus HD100]
MSIKYLDQASSSYVSVYIKKIEKAHKGQFYIRNLVEAGGIEPPSANDPR